MYTNFKLKGIVCLLFIIMGVYTIKGQSFHYYYNNQKVEVSLDKNYVSVNSLNENCFLESDSLKHFTKN